MLIAQKKIYGVSLKSFNIGSIVVGLRCNLRNFSLLLVIFLWVRPRNFSLLLTWDGFGFRGTCCNLGFLCCCITALPFFRFKFSSSRIVLWIHSLNNRPYLLKWNRLDPLRSLWVEVARDIRGWSVAQIELEAGHGTCRRYRVRGRGHLYVVGGGLSVSRWWHCTSLLGFLS